MFLMQKAVACYFLFAVSLLSYFLLHLIGGMV